MPLILPLKDALSNFCQFGVLHEAQDGGHCDDVVQSQLLLIEGKQRRKVDSIESKRAVDHHALEEKQLLFHHVRSAVSRGEQPVEQLLVDFFGVLAVAELGDDIDVGRIFVRSGLRPLHHEEKNLLQKIESVLVTFARQK